MIVNKKKSIRLQNRTNYFDPDKDKVAVRFSSPETYQSRQMKIEGYENRLYWQFKYCDDHDGQTFFYTLTYNDNAMPEMYGINCFDYNDLRDLLTGGFRKQLLRKYGSTFKYFIGAELGDGKGKRGMHNNPHYHILLFVENAHHDKFPYVKIGEKDMTHLVRLYWQGFDEDVDGYRDYNTAKYGIVKEGKFGATVKDFRACAYCSKYVTKDVKLVKHETKVEKSLRFKLRNEYRYKDEVYSSFFHEEINPMFNTPLDAKNTKWSFTDVQLIKEIDPHADDWYRQVYGHELATLEDTGYMPFVALICDSQNLWSHFEAYVDRYIEPMVQEGLNEWRNRYSNKCRISQGVGEYAIEHVRNKLNPYIQVPGKKGMKNRPISMYYYRKMYCDVVKDPNGNNLYVLNELGIQYKAARLPAQIKKMTSKCKDYIPALLDDEKLFNEMRDSDINTEVWMNHAQFKVQVERLLKNDDLQNILQRYAEYKLVYEDRFFSYQLNGDNGAAIIPELNLIADYKRFLVPSFYSVPRNDLRLACFLEDIPENYLAYSQHPYFSRYIGIFGVLDMCSDYFFVQNDDKKQREAEEIAATKRFHDKRELKEFYKVFVNA